MKITFFPLMLTFLFIMSCKMESSEPIYSLKPFSEEGIKAVIEIPAGTNHKIEFNPKTKKFECDQLDGKDRVVSFLPYPGNYGFIPSTYMAPEAGGDGDALDILVIAESVETGTVMIVIPIASLDLLDNGELDTKIIAIPADSALQILPAANYQEFAVNYHGAQNLIKDWFLNYKGVGEVEFLGWHNEQVALATIRKWTK